MSTVDDLERFEVLVVDAELIAPRTSDSLTGQFGYEAPAGTSRGWFEGAFERRPIIAT